MPGRHFLFVRHAESTKNVAKRLSGPVDSDRISAQGSEDSRQLASDLACLIAAEFNQASVRVCSSTSLRALETASAIGDILAAPVVSSELLCSMVVPETGGLSEDQLRDSFPESWRALQLYRHGLRSSYTIEFIDERLREFEERVVQGLNEVAGGDRTVNLVVAHRSTITALLMHFARRAGDIPQDHYGFVPLDLLCVSLVSERGESTRLEFVNRRGSDLRGGLLADGWPAASIG